MTKYDTKIQRFLCDYCEKNTPALRCETKDFQIILCEPDNFGYTALVINDYMPNLIFVVKHDDVEKETNLDIFRKDDTLCLQDEVTGL